MYNIYLINQVIIYGHFIILNTYSHARSKITSADCLFSFLYFFIYLMFLLPKGKVEFYGKYLTLQVSEEPSRLFVFSFFIYLFIVFTARRKTAQLLS